MTFGCEIYEPPAILRGLPPRPRLFGGARHYGTDLRHLPRRLPDGRLPCAGKGAGRVPASRSGDPYAPQSALLRRVDRKPRAAHVHAALAGLSRLRERDQHGRRPWTGWSSGRCGSRRSATIWWPCWAAARCIRLASVWAVSIGLPMSPRPRHSYRRSRPAWTTCARSSQFLAERIEFPRLERDYEFVALCPDDEYPMNLGRIKSNKGLDVAQDEFLDAIEEVQVEHSTALHARVKVRGSYLVGPLARLNLCARSAAPPRGRTVTEDLRSRETTAALEQQFP